MFPLPKNTGNARWRLGKFLSGPALGVILIIILVVGGSLWLVIANANQRASTQSAQATRTAISLTSTAFAGTATAHSQATATAHFQATATAHFQATATARALAPLNPDPSFKTLAYHDPMTVDSGNWDVGSSELNAGECSFQEDGFNIFAPPIDTSDTIVSFPLCQLRTKTFFDFSFVTHIKISTGGECGVLIFKDKNLSDLNYEVDVCQDGNYSIQGDPRNTMGGISKAIKQGRDQINTVAVVIHGLNFTLFINSQRIASVRVELLSADDQNIDARFSSCQIGLSTSGGSEFSDIVYSDLTIWTA